MRCPQCGAAVSAVLYRCGHCGTVLPPPAGAVPAVPVLATAEPEKRIRLLDGWAAAAMGLSWLATLLYVLGNLLTLRDWSLGTPTTSIDVVGGRSVLDLSYLVVCLAAGATFVTWLFLARRNLNAFPGANPAWGEPWSVTVWCLPLVVVAAMIYAVLFTPEILDLAGVWPLVLPVLPMLALAVGAAVIADVVRHSGDGASAFERQRYVAKAWLWWILCLATVAVPRAGLILTIQAGLASWEIAETGIFITVAGVTLALGCVCAILAVSRLSSIVNWVSAEHRHRIERQWDGGLGQRAAVGFDAC